MLDFENLVKLVNLWNQVNQIDEANYKDSKGDDEDMPTQVKSVMTDS